MSFRLKTIIGIAVIEAILLVALVWSSINFLKTSNEEALIQRVNSSANLFALTITDAVLALDLATVEASVNAMSHAQDLSYLRVIDEEGITLASKGTALILGRPFKADTSIDSVDDGIFDTRVDISEAGITFAHVEMGFSIEPLQKLIADARQHTAIIAGVEMLLVALFSLLLGTYLTRQLASLILASQEISKGNLSYRIPITGNDELALTARSFNDMSEKLRLHQEIEAAQKQELAASEEQYRTTIESALDCIIIIDAEGKVIEFNPAAEKCFGYSRNAAIGQNLAELIIPDEMRAAHLGAMQRYLRTREGKLFGQHIEMEALRSDGTRFPVELAIVPSRNAAGTIFIGYIRDIEEQKNADSALLEAKERAEVANVAKSKFLATMSHEIRTPLNGVLGMLGILDTTRLDRDQRHYVQTSRNSGEALLQIINDILDFSKMEASHLRLEIGNFDIRALVGGIVEMLSATIGHKDVVLEFHVDEKIPGFVKGDSGRIRQILFNLVGNAAKFTETGRVTVRVSRGEKDTTPIIRFEIEDTGQGIPEAAQDTLFTRFTQVRNPLDVHPGGTGLGLAISKKLVDAMQGKIGVSSTVGKGSIFWFEIPLEASSGSEVAQFLSRERAHSETLGQQTKPIMDTVSARILLAEDNPTNSEIAKIMLEKEGHHVDVVGDGAEVVAAAGAFPYDLILMDISMPVTDGLEATRQIRSFESVYADVPIIAMTAHVMEDDRTTILDAGMNDYLPKPFSREQMLEILARWAGSEAELGSGQVTVPEAPLLTDEESPGDLIDYAILKKLETDTDVSLVPMLVRTFTDDATKRLDNITSAVAEKNIEVLRFEAHSLKSSSISFGALLLREKSLELELESEKNNTEDSMRLAESVVSVGRATITQLNRYIDAMTAT